MSIPSCPKCKRKTYSPKFGTCTACGYEKPVVVETVTETVAPEKTPLKRVAETVTMAPPENVTVSPDMERVTADETVAEDKVYHSVPGERCSKCGYMAPKKSTERVRKWRAKNERA